MAKSLNVQFIACALTAGLGLLSGTSALAEVPPTSWNLSADPAAPYGHCREGATAFGNKLDAVAAVGESLADIIAIKVLSCQPFGGGSWAKQACPPGAAAFDFCMRAGNDGLGNDVAMGVMRLGPLTDPNGKVSDCTDGTQGPVKVELLRAARRDPRRVTGVVTLSCTGAEAAGTGAMQAPIEVPCPGRGHPYSFCLATSQDGLGHAVTVGVVGAHGAGDPYALYGECDAWGILPGFGSKASLVKAVGRSLENVRSIDVLACAINWGLGVPTGLYSGPCTGQVFISPTQAARHDYCIWGTDARHNGVILGVNAP